MKNKLHISVWLLFLLSGCTSINDSKFALTNNNLNETDFIVKATKLLNADTVNKDSENFYMIGKRFEKAYKIDEAIRAYSKSISLNAMNEDSIEALALLYVNKGDLIAAISMFEALIKINPSASNYNNLGYSYYLNKNLDAAKVALEQSVKIDSAYKKAINNLTLISHQNLKVEEAKLAKTETVNNLQKELNATQNEVQELSNVKSIEFSQTNQDENAPIKKLMKNVYEIMTTNQKVTIKKIDDQSIIKNVENKFVTLENRSILNLQIVNGNGEKGIARLVAEKITNNKYEIKLANLKPYNKNKTTLQYRSENYEDAIKLMISLKNKPQIVQNNNLPKSIGVRLILGKDFTSDMI